MINLIAKGIFRIDNRLKLILIAVVVGVTGGLAAVLLNFGLHHAATWLAPHRDRWFGVLFPAAGLLIAVFLIRVVFRDPGAHGVPEVIYAVSKRGGLLRLRTGFSRLIACLFTLSGGGSAGPEAPVVVSGASIGSNIAGRFGLKDRQRIIMAGCGASAAIASIFNAPAAGILFTMEVVLGEWTQVNLIPIAIASVAGCEISRLLQGNQIPFEHRDITVTYVDLIACVFLSLVISAAAVGFIRLVQAVTRAMESTLKNIWIRAGLAGLVIGVVGLFFPDALGEGYLVIRKILSNEYLLGMSMVGAVIAIKMLSVSVTVGGGGVGGIFAPCLVLGAMTGLLFHKAAMILFPNLPFSYQGYYALVGMAGMLSGVLKAPLSAIFLIMEITGGYDVLASVVLVSVLSTTMSGIFEPLSFYHKDLVRKGLLLRARTDARVLSEIRVVELLEKDCRIVSPSMKLGDFVRLVATSKRNYFPVENDDKEFLGIVKLDTVRSFLFDRMLYDSVLVEEIMETDIPTIHPDDSLADVISTMDSISAFSLPVVEHGRFLGLISKATLLDHYRLEMAAQEE
jgi:CIC family chloride channel protein